MVTTDKPIEIEQVSCEICMKEIPASEATIPEALDYVVHFCGLECYETWKRRGAKPPDSPAPDSP